MWSNLSLLNSWLPDRAWKVCITRTAAYSAPDAMKQEDYQISIITANLSEDIFDEHLIY